MKKSLPWRAALTSVIVTVLFDAASLALTSSDNDEKIKSGENFIFETNNDFFTESTFYGRLESATGEFILRREWMVDVGTRL